MKLLIFNTCVITTILLLNLIVSTVDAKNDNLGLQCKANHIRDPPPPGVMTQGEIWPFPNQVLYTGTRAIGSSKSQPIQIHFNSDGEKCDILRFARETYLSKWLFPYGDPENNSAETLVLRVHFKAPCPGPDEFPGENMDEEYVLNVNRNVPSHLDAFDVWGVLRGIETFSQMIYFENNTYFIRTGRIQDFPRSNHRGILLDTSVHYLSPITIKRQIDLMAMNKLNVLHWNTTDLYNPDTIQDILHYARLRGIRVLPQGTTEETRVVGGEICMPDESVDSKNIEFRSWPDLSLVAERFWSFRNGPENVLWPRLREFICLMLARGYRVQTGDAANYCPTEWN